MITFVYTYYNNPDMLARQLQEWLVYPGDVLDKLRFIIVDDGSMRAPALPVIQQSLQGQRDKLKLSLYRVTVDIPWNMDGARNLAMKECETEWAFLCDIDHLVPADQVPRAFEMPFAPRTAFMPNQVWTSGVSLGRPHPNSYLMRKEDYWFVGGMDEDFAGFYGSDGNFRRLLTQWGIVLIYTTTWNVVVYGTGDIYDANTKGLGRKDSDRFVKRNAKLWEKVRGPRYKPVDPIRFPWERLI